MNNLLSLGSQALLLAFAGTLGSVLAAWIVYRLFFKNKE
jgi:high-affinity Fe2+/Pb2+ permease